MFNEPKVTGKICIPEIFLFSLLISKSTFVRLKFEYAEGICKFFELIFVIKLCFRCVQYKNILFDDCESNVTSNLENFCKCQSNCSVSLNKSVDFRHPCLLSFAYRKYLNVTYICRAKTGKI